MRHTLILATLLLCSGAIASPSNPCEVPAPPGIVKPYRDLQAPARTDATPPVATGYACAPAPAGAGTLPTLRTNGAGAVVWWYCKAAGRWTPQWAAATAERLSVGSIAADAYAVAIAADPLAAVNALAAKNITLPLSDPSLTPVWCPFQQEMHDGTPAPDAPPAPAPAYLVAKNASYPTRPSYAVVAGVRAKTSKTTAAVGARCDATVTIVEGSTTYMQVAAGLVAVCVKAPA